MVTPLAPAPAHPGADPAATPPLTRPPLWRTVLHAPFSARAWRDYAYLLVGAILAAVAFGTLATLLWLSIILTTVVVGILLFALTVRAARIYAAAPRALADSLLDEHVATPRRRPRRRGLLGWLGSSFGDVDGWRSIAFIIVSTPVTIAGAYSLVLLWGMSAAAVTYPIWWSVYDPENIDSDGVVRHSGLQIGEFYFDTWPRAFAVSAIGIALLFAIPWVARGFTTVDRLLVRGLLGPTHTSDRVDDLQITRAQAVDQSAATLRRIERDLHDGTQARLVALAMHLDMARDQLDNSPPEETARARELLERAHRDAIDAIAELREVTRSIHPPALDRGLGDALATLAARSGVPTDLEVRIASRPSPAIETIAFYCAAELLTNVAKHAGATRATIAVTAQDGVLRVQVIDDGRGGAHLAQEGGLAGLAERVGTVDGHLALSSPAGGPTVAVVELPLSAG
ncbi:MAG TPA: sensor domain-containing protein [Acidimicrobiales bacterium]|nr:sensor domain-containing protein [Acidimicrobiales bacterium]